VIVHNPQYERVMLQLLRNRLFIFQFAVLVVGIGAIIGIGYTLLDSYLRDTQLSGMPETTASRAQQLATILRYKELLLQRLATDEAVGRFIFSDNPKDIQPLFEKFIPEFKYIELLNDKNEREFGIVPVDVIPPEVNRDLLQQLLWRPNRPFTILQPGDDDAIFLYYLENFGEFGGIFLAGTPDQELIRILGDMHYGKNGFFLVTDSQGTILLADPLHLAVNALSTVIPFWHGNEAEIQRLQVGNKTCYVSASPVTGGDWWLIGVLPEDEFLSIPHRLLNILVGLAVLTLAAWVLVTILFSPKTDRPGR